MGAEVCRAGQPHRRNGRIQHSDRPFTIGAATCLAMPEASVVVALRLAPGSIDSFSILTLCTGVTQVRGVAVMRGEDDGRTPNVTTLRAASMHLLAPAGADP